jgi:hypothetical protein
MKSEDSKTEIQSKTKQLGKRHRTIQTEILFILADALGYAGVSCYGRREFHDA